MVKHCAYWKHIEKYKDREKFGESTMMNGPIEERTTSRLWYGFNTCDVCKLYSKFFSPEAQWFLQRYIMSLRFPPHCHLHEREMVGMLQASTPINLPSTSSLFLLWSCFIFLQDNQTDLRWTWFLSIAQVIPFTIDKYKDLAQTIGKWWRMKTRWWNVCKQGTQLQSYRIRKL